MKDIAIYGAGGFGKEVALLIERLNKHNGSRLWNMIGFFDDGKETGFSVSRFGKVLGDLATLNAWERELSVAIAIGNPKTLYKISQSITNCMISFPTLIDKSFHICDPDTTNIGIGNIIMGPGTTTADITIGNFNLLNGSVVIGHDVTIGDYNMLMPGVRISGEVNIGDCNLFGVNSVVLQRLNIGSGVHLGAGSVLMTKSKDGGVYIGVPAKRFKY